MSTIIDKIKELKTKGTQLFLLTIIQRGDVQDIADFTGDSLGLSQQAAKTKANVIMFLRCAFYGRNRFNTLPGQAGIIT